MSNKTSFLAKLGAILAEGLQIVSTFFPILKPFLGSGTAATVATTAVNDFTQIGQMALQVEVALQGATGPAKLAALVKLITPIIQSSELVSGHTPTNPALFAQGCNEVGQGVVDILNSLPSDAIKTTGTALPATPAPASAPVAK
jgi:hypothetical protein